MSLADQIAAKKLKKAEERPVDKSPPPSGGGGGDMMGELAKALNRRSTLKPARSEPDASAAPGPPEPKAVEPKIKAKAPGTPVGTPGLNRKKMPLNRGSGAVPSAGKPSGGAGAAGAAGVSAEDLGKLKKELVEAFRAELAIFKTELLAEIGEMMTTVGGEEEGEEEAY